MTSWVEVMKNNMIFLSWKLNEQTPSYGDREKLMIKRTSSIENGDVANNSFIQISMHMGTHLDMPFHFFQNGQTIEDFQADFWIFEKVGFLEVNPSDFVINEELQNDLYKLPKDIELLIVKTGACFDRDKDAYKTHNYGFHEEIAYKLREKFPKLRLFGFDTISVSSFQDRQMGRKAHKAFLNPENPILLLEDMDLREVDQSTSFKEVLVAPLRVSQSDGILATVIAKTAS
jgi:kynurenine formamidase